MTRTEGLACTVLAAIGLTAASHIHKVVKAPEQPREIRAETPREIRAELYVAPIVQFRVLSGNPKPGAILTQCVQAEIATSWGDHTDRFKTLDCEEGIRLELDNVWFDSQAKVVLHVEAK